MHRICRLGIWLMFIAMATLMGGARPSSSVYAQERANTVGMVETNCAGLTESLLLDAEDAGICNGQATGGVAPNGTVGGSCGSSTLYVFNDGGGDARFFEAAHSTDGPIARVHWEVHWYNNRTEVQGTTSGSDYLASSDWSNDDVMYTDTGLVNAYMTGYVALYTGEICTFLDPSDYATIT